MTKVILGTVMYTLLVIGIKDSNLELGFAINMFAIFLLITFILMHLAVRIYFTHHDPDGKVFRIRGNKPFWVLYMGTFLITTLWVL